MKSWSTIAGVAAGACLAMAEVTPAHAHVCMDMPVSRVGSGCNFISDQKVGPCGVAERGTNVTTFRPGETITVQLNETINHPSHYRIAFNPDGDDFEDPTSKDDKDGKHPHVLLDDITDDEAAKQSVKVTLPNVTCDNCTLQLIQVMYDKAGNGFGGNDGSGGKADNDDLYYACADLVLKGEPVAGGPAGEPGDAGTSPGTGGIEDAGSRPAGRTDAGGVASRDAGTEEAASDGGGSPSTTRSDGGRPGGSKPGAGAPDAGRADPDETPTDDDADGESDHGNDEHDEHDDDRDETTSADEGCSLGRSDSEGAALAALITLGMFVARRRRKS